MSDIVIIKDDIESIININNNIASGYKATKDGLYPIGDEEINIINSIKPSKSLTKIKTSNEYDIYIDNITKLVHFFKDGKEDLAKFIKTNTYQIILYNTNSKTNKNFDKREKIYLKLPKIIIGISITALITIMSCDIANNVKYKNEINDLIKTSTDKIEVDYLDKEPLTLELFHEIIQNETTLNDDEKEYLDNELFVSDLLPYIEESCFKYTITDRLKGLHISSYKKQELENSYGYYRPGTNEIHVLNYNEKKNIDNYKDTLAHEFCHIFQNNLTVNYLLEGTAEILSYEYFEDTSIDSYKNCVFNTKLLMEIIGPDIVLQSITSNKFSPIINELKNYLSTDDIEILMQDFMHVDFNDTNIQYVELRITSRLLRAYENKYGHPLNGEIEAAMHSDDYHRYYFNSEKRDKQEENYIDEHNYECVDIKYAFNNDLIDVFSYEIENISYAKYLEESPLLFEWNISLDNFIVLTPNIKLTDIKLMNRTDYVGVDLQNSIITYEENGVVSETNVNNLIVQGLVDVTIPRYVFTYYTFEDYLKLSGEEKTKLVFNKNYSIKDDCELLFVDYIKNKVYFKKNIIKEQDRTEATPLDPLPNHEYQSTLTRN